MKHKCLFSFSLITLEKLYVPITVLYFKRASFKFNETAMKLHSIQPSDFTLWDNASNRTEGGA